MKFKVLWIAGLMLAATGVYSPDPTFGGMVTVSSFGGASDLNFSGSYFLAANVGSTTSAGNLTVGSANFLSLSNGFNATGGLATLSGAWGDLDPYATLPVYSGGSASDNTNLGQIMHSLDYTSSSPMTVTVNSLSTNTTYIVQVLISENFWTSLGQRQFGININGDVALASNADIIGLAYSGDNLSGRPTRGVVVTNTFTTGGSQTSATIEAIYGTGTGDHNAYFNAFTVQAVTAAVPEPASIAMWSLGAIGLVVAGRKRRQMKLAA